MDMDGWRDILHFDFHGEHVLFSSLRLSSGFTFLIASLLTVFLCLLEKYLTYILSTNWKPIPFRRSRLGNATFRTGIYWVLTLIRLIYMLLAMTFHVGLILVVVTTLSAGQFFIEYTETQHSHVKLSQLEGTPLLGRSDLEGPADDDVDIPSPGTTNRPLAASGYPPRRTAGPRTQNPTSDVDISRSSKTIFAIDDEDSTV